MAAPTAQLTDDEEWAKFKVCRSFVHSGLKRQPLHLSFAPRSGWIQQDLQITGRRSRTESHFHRDAAFRGETQQWRAQLHCWNKPICRHGNKIAFTLYMLCPLVISWKFFAETRRISEELLWFFTKALRIKCKVRLNYWAQLKLIGPQIFWIWTYT